MSPSHQSRQTETRLRIVAALDECMETTHIEKVRVVEVCRIADVSRTTFYEYFDDIYAVGTWMWDYLMEQTLYQAGRRYGLFEAHLRKFKALLKYKHFFMCAFRGTEYPSITQHGGRVMLSNYLDVLEEKMGSSLTRAEELKMEFFVTGAKHMTRYWVEDGMEETPEMMAHVFCSAFPAFARPYFEETDDIDDANDEGDDGEPTQRAEAGLTQKNLAV